MSAGFFWNQRNTGGHRPPLQWPVRSTKVRIRSVAVGERIGTQLEMDDIGRSSSAAFAVPWRAAAPRRPQSPGAPAAVGIVDASLKSFGEKPHRIRDGNVDPLPICKRLHAVGLIFENDHGVFAKAEDIVDVDPYVIRARNSSQRAFDAVELRSGYRMQREPFRTVISRSGGPIADPALAAVEADEIAPHTCGPGDALAVEVHPANAEFGWRKLVGLGQSGHRRIRTQIHSDDPASTRRIRSPDAPVIGVDCNAVKAEVEAFIFAGIDRGIGLDVIVAFAVAVGVDDEWRPALRFSGVAGLQEYPGVDPAQFRAAIVGKI